MRETVLIGAWKLVSFTVIDEATHEEVRPWGPNPHGRMIFSESGYMSATLAAGEGAPSPPPQVTERLGNAARKPTLAYTGAYRVEGNAFITSVDTSWPDGWVGTEQRRDFTIDGDTLTITTVSHTTPEGKTRHGVLVWHRE